jgi:hypothetical protein
MCRWNRAIPSRFGDGPCNIRFARNSSGLKISQIRNEILLDIGGDYHLNQFVGGNYSLNQTGISMPITDLIGKVLYPRKQRWERRRNVKSLVVAAVIILIIIALFGLVMMLKGSVQFKPDVPQSDLP